MHLSDRDLKRLSQAAQKQIRQSKGRESKTKAAAARKYNNKPCLYEFPGGAVQKFDSEKERDRFAELYLEQKRGDIESLRCQVEYTLIPSQKRDDGTTERPCKYIADFVYIRDGNEIVEDVKGYRDPKSAGYAKFVIKRKLMLDRYGISVKEIG